MCELDVIRLALECRATQVKMAASEHEFIGQRIRRANGGLGKLSQQAACG